MAVHFLNNGKVVTVESDVYQPCVPVPPLPPRYRLRDVIWGDHMLYDDGDRSDVIIIILISNICLIKLIHVV